MNQDSIKLVLLEEVVRVDIRGARSHVVFLCIHAKEIR